MRQEETFFDGREPVLVYIAKKLREAKRIEEMFDAASVDYLVEPDRYRGGVLFVRELVGAFFYVDDAQMDAARSCLRAAGLKPYEPEPAG